MNPANRAAKQDIEEWLKPTLEKENLKNYFVNITGSSAKGDNYLGDVTFVEVSGETENTSKTYNFVVKCGKKSEELRKIMPVRTAFKNEIYFYNEVLPVLLKFQEKNHLEEPFNNTAKCFDTFILDTMEVLILEDMKKKDYVLHDRNNPMNEDHIRLIMKTYGKLHALSYALRDQKPELFKKISENLVDLFKEMRENIESSHHSVFDDVLKIALHKKDSKLAEKINEMKEATLNFTSLTDPTDPYAVILHGDCWNNNFMFKYEGNQRAKPSDVCMLDFQISRLASPVFDLSYYLFCSIPENAIHMFDDFVKIYYESLSNSIRKLGSDPEKVFPFEELTRQWKKFGKFGIMMMPSIIRICVSDKDEVNDLAETAESGVKIQDAFSYTVKNIQEYEKRTIPVLKLAMDKGII